MAPSTKGSSEGDNLISDIKSSLDSIYKTKVTVAGHNTHTVSPARLEQLERRIDRALAHQGESGASPTELISLHEQISELRTENDKMKSRLNDAIAAEKSAMAARDASAAKLQIALEDNEKAKVEQGAIKKQLQSDLFKATSDLKQVRQALGSSEARFDPAAAEALSKAKEEASAQVKSLNSKLAAVNRELARRQQEFNSATNSMKQQLAAFEQAKSATAQLKNLLHDAASGKKELVFSPAIEALLGKQACEILAGWQTTAFDNVKDRAFIGMKALSRHKNGLLSAIGKLFHTVYEWCKTKAVSARKALVPWMDMVIADLLAAKLRAVSFYRDELKKLQVIAEQQKQKKKEANKSSGVNEHSGTEGWFSDLWFYGYAIILRVRRRAAPPVAKAKYGFIGLVKATGTWIKQITKFQLATYSELFETGELLPQGGKAKAIFDMVWPNVVRSFWSAWPQQYRPEEKSDVIFEVPEDEAPQATPI